FQEKKIGTESNIDVSLVAAEKSMEEVVVIGYGTQKQKNVTGSVATISPKKLEDLPVASLTEMLRGQVPGVNVSGGSTRPGSMAQVSIRQQFNWGKDGGGTIPLIIIDDIVQIDPATNLPTLDKFNMLDLSEVESITVLRDASAAIYGARASQGAIVVKTKRGKLGSPRITYSAKFEMNDAVSHSDVMNTKEYGLFSNRLNRAAGASQQTFFTPTELSAMDSVNYDWLENDWKSAGAMQHSITVSGGSEKATFFTGGSYYSQGANLGSQDFNRWTFRAGTDVKLMNDLKFSASLAANNSSLEKSFTKVNISDGYAGSGGLEQNDYAILLHMPKYIPWQYTINGVNQFVSPPLGPNKPGAASGNNSLSNWNY
ncbi:MAG TPA: TonB-dependent receptor plug domain-containing protein, partial [Saprospiraceae bacterium]|nr:TonB-dependent receptor plug domain-containing protein [Saprospiraceae bacterium]